MLLKSFNEASKMHELSIAQNILEIVAEHIPAGTTSQVKSVRIKVGDGAGIVSDSLEFCFNAIIAETPMQGAVLEIEPVPFVVKCNSCGKISTNENGMFLCLFCGVNNVTMVSGNELQVSAIELFDEKEVAV
jgi:hydrogenase nickel incorporation protein HypA/HybF